MVKINSNWKATLLFGFGLVASVYFLWANQYNHLTDAQDQRYAYLSTQIFVITGLKFFLFIYWLVNLMSKSDYSYYYFLIFFAAISVVTLYM